MKSGEVVVDWGDGRVQDVLTGDFLPYTEQDYGGAVQDTDLAALQRNGRVEFYDARTIYLSPLPEPPRKTIE
jgi:hypothetical protein